MRRIVLWGIAGMLAVGSLSACEKVNAVASSVSPCFKVLPAAHAAVGGQGTFVDVARVAASRLPHLHPLIPLPGLHRSHPTSTSTPTTLPHQDNTCLVAYKGTFDPAKIALLSQRTRSGQYAIVVVGIKTQRVRVVFLVNTLPKPLHSH